MRQANRRGIVINLSLLVILFALPPLLGWIYFMNPQWLPERVTNHGILISPPRAMQSLTLTDDNQSPFDWQSLTGQWTLVTLNRGRCATACQEQLKRLQQVRRAVGGERVRIQRLLIQAPQDTTQASKITETQTRGATVLYLRPENLPELDRLFQVSGIEKQAATFLIDPNGMLMMAHRNDQPTKAILQDLERLLKASRNWI